MLVIVGVPFFEEFVDFLIEYGGGAIFFNFMVSWGAGLGLVFSWGSWLGLVFNGGYWLGWGSWLGLVFSGGSWLGLVLNGGYWLCWGSGLSLVHNRSYWLCRGGWISRCDWLGSRSRDGSSQLSACQFAISISVSLSKGGIEISIRNSLTACKIECFDLFFGQEAILVTIGAVEEICDLLISSSCRDCDRCGSLLQVLQVTEGLAIDRAYK